jgi:4-amino-4-deoxy-L-arabinose transferase-like glycosyltransferase
VGPRALGSAECPTGAGDAGRSLLHRKSPIGRGLFLFAVLAPLAIAFAWQGQLASFGDDSASYLTLANYFSPSGDPIVSEWAGYHANFPPLLPLLLAITGGVHNLHMAYVLVALFGAAGVALFYRYAALELGERGGLLAAILFLLTTTAWIALKGVLSESLYLFALMASLVYYQKRIAERQPSTGEWLLFGFLLACAALSRAIGILLLGAYLVHLAVAAWKERRLVARAWIPAIVVVVLVGLWYAFRPKAPTDMYGVASTWVMGWWLGNPGEMLHGATNLLFSGWVRSFMADHDVTLGAKIVFGAVGVLGFVEALLRAKRNRLDGWFVLLSLGVIFVWTFTPETTRRLLYPLVPLMILYAMSITQAIAGEASPRRSPRAVGERGDRGAAGAPRAAGARLSSQESHSMTGS